MKIFLEINNKTDCKIDKKKIELIVEETVKMSGIKNLGSKGIDVSAGIVFPQEIRKINNKYRNMNSSTDILSFSSYADQNDILKERGRRIFLGEIIVCPEDMKKYADRKKISLADELVRVFSHGTLHLLGFSHGKDMFSVQEKVVKSFNKIDLIKN